MILIEPFQRLFDSHQELIKGIIYLFIPLLDRENNFYWIYTLSSFFLIFGLYIISKPYLLNFSWRELLNYCLPHSIYTHKSAILDYQCYFINGLIQLVIQF